MKRVIAVLISIAMLLSLSACGGGRSSQSQRKEMAAPSGATDAYYYDGAAMEDAAAAEHEEAAAGNNSTAGSDAGPNAYQSAEVKLIRRASLRLETTEFDAAVAGLEDLVNTLGGYLEDSSVNQGNYGSSYRSASYTVRIPSKKYSDFLNRISDDKRCHLVNKSESTEDVGQQYFDTETRLKTLRTKLDRLQTLLQKAEKMEDIISLEDAISDTEYQIDRYSSTLKRYDSLIGYSTFSISISQVTNLSDTDTIPYGERLLNAFTSGMRNFGEGVQEFALWLAGNVMSVVMLIAFILLIRFLLKRRRSRKAMNPKAKQKVRKSRKPLFHKPDETSAIAPEAQAQQPDAEPKGPESK